MQKTFDASKFVVSAGMAGTVGGVAFTYYPVSVGLTFKLKQFAEPIGKLMAALFENKEQRKIDVGSNTRRIEQKADDGANISEYITQAISPELAAERHRQRAQAVGELINTLMNDNSMNLLCEIIMDSLREEFPRQIPRHDPFPPQEFANRFDFPLFCEHLVHVAKANAGMFGPLFETAGINAQALSDLAKSALSKAVKQAPAPVSTDGTPSTTKPAGSSNDSATEPLPS